MCGFVQVFCGFTRNSADSYENLRFASSLLERPQSADKSLFEQKAPKIGTQKCSTKRGVREPLHVEFALNNRELVKAEVFEQTTPLK